MSSSTVSTKIKEISGKSACVAWCPINSHPDVIVLGAKDSVGGFDDTGGFLEFYDVSGSISDEPKLIGSIKTTSRFSSLAWTSYTGESKQFPLGVIAGGMIDGNVHVFDPNEILGSHSENHGNSLLGTVKQQSQPSKNPVTAMKFSPSERNELCFGSANGQIFVVDISTVPDLVSSNPVPTQSTAEVTCVAWNPVVAHIVATSSGDGSVTVWDLKSKKAWCELRAEQSGQAVSDIRWNPSQSSQGLHLLTASADDRNPVIRVWDLGASTSMPLATLSGHRLGILKTSWCPHDDSLLLSCGKDNRTILWDLYTLQPIADVPTDSKPPSTATQTAPNPNAIFGAGGGAGLNEQKHIRFDVQWSPTKRGIVMTCSLDKKVQIHTVLALATKSGRPPAWMKPLSSVSWGFGGSIVSTFKNPDPTDTRKFVLLSSFVEAPELVQLSQAVENDLVSSTFIEFCRNEKQRTTDKDSQELWGFMEVISEADKRQKLLEHLDYHAEQINIAATGEELVTGLESLSVDEKDATGVSNAMSLNAKELVTRALVVGNFEAAVEVCFRTGNLADALILASFGGAELWTKSQQRFFQLEATKRPYLSMIGDAVSGQLDTLISDSQPGDWRQTLALLATYSQADDFSRLCIVLGDRLKEQGEEKNASLCYLCASNLERAIEYWKDQLDIATSSRLTSMTETVTSKDIFMLQEFIVRTYALLQATNSIALPGDIEDLFTKYAQTLADNGLYVTATKYVQGASTTAKILRDRLYRSRASNQCLQVLGQAPEYPYQIVAIEESRGQVIVNASETNKPEGTATTNGYDGTYTSHHDSLLGSTQLQQQAAYPDGSTLQQQQPIYAANQQSYVYETTAPVPTGQTSSPDQLPPGWIALQDPSSGMTYYANQATGETTWDQPQMTPAPASAPIQHQYSDMDQSRQGPKSTSSALVSKYGDGFVTSASNPELAQQYGNVGTSNPYTGSARPNLARAQPEAKKPQVSGSLNFDQHQLTDHQQSVKDNLLACAEALKQTNLNPVDKRQVAEAEKGVAILVKKMAMGVLSEDSIGRVYQMVTALCNRDYATATSAQTYLANTEWRDHKDWLKGVKILITLASKKL